MTTAYTALDTHSGEMVGKFHHRFFYAPRAGFRKQLRTSSGSWRRSCQLGLIRPSALAKAALASRDVASIGKAIGSDGSSTCSANGSSNQATSCHLLIL